jgi:hypothetical protein
MSEAKHVMNFHTSSYTGCSGSFYVVNTKSVEKILSKLKRQFISIAKYTQAIGMKSLLIIKIINLK